MLVPVTSFQNCLMFVGKAIDYPSEAPFRSYPIWSAQGLTHKHETGLKRSVRYKHFKLLRAFVNYRR